MAQHISPIISRTEVYDLHIPKQVEEKIRYFCNEFPDNEWSGILFYKPEGSFEDGSFKINCLDIFLMDIGTSGFTEFDDSCDVISYQALHPELLEDSVQEGLIHSHNKMSAFFSGTDLDTLKEEGSRRNHFLSLIINNAGLYVAKITRTIIDDITETIESTKVIDRSYNTFDDDEIVLANAKEEYNTTNSSYTKTTLEAFDLNIIVDKAELDGNYTELAERVTEIKEQKKNIVIKRENISFLKTNDIWKFNFKHDAYGDLAAKIMLSNIFANENDLRLWYRTIDNKYTRDFGSLDNPSLKLTTWLEMFIEYVLYYYTEEEYLENNQDEINTLVEGIVDYLYTMPESKYKDLVVEALEAYIV